MPASAAPPNPSLDTPPPTLSTRPFPRRVRRLLEGVLEFASDEIERALNITLNDVEQQLFKLAEQARSNDVQQRCFEALRAVKRGRADVTPRYMIGLEAALAGIKDPPEPEKNAAVGITRFGELALVEDVELDEAAVLDEIAGRAEIRNSLPLYLLCQRFGVLAGRPAFEAERLPVGPHALCRILQQAIACLELNSEHRMLVFRQFDRQLMPVYGAFVEALNTFLIREGVLPRLTYVPVRPRPPRAEPVVANEAETAAPRLPRSGAPDADRTPAMRRRADSGLRPHTAWPGETTWSPPSAPAPDSDSDSGEANEMFAILRQLLAGRRQLAGKFGQPGGTPARSGPAFVASQEDVESVLGLLQQKPASAVLVDGKPAPRSVHHVKQDLLAQLRQWAPEGAAPTLADEDADTIDLVGMLFDHIMKDVRPNSPAAVLLAKLQVPLLRVALRDKGFFTRQRHPARQMLNAIAESGAYWVGEDEAERGTVEKMRMLVDRVVTEFNGDPTLFEALLQDLSGHLQTSVHKAEVAERRHVEAARGKERLALARMRACEAIGARVKGKKLPRFVHTLLTQAWADVLALTALRQGEDSELFTRQLAIADRLVRASCASAGSEDALTAEEAGQMRQEIEQALTQVGYHGEDAAAIAARMLSGSDDNGKEDAASRTELALRLKARARLGEELEADKRKARTTPLDDEAKACLEQIKHLPFGTWFEFMSNQQGDRVRRRLSWYSTITGHALFVNHRGQRVGEYTLEWLAQAMAAQQVRIVPAEKGTIIDRAWHAILGALRSFSGNAGDERGGGSQS
ncbi:MAG: DUF1631 domain-containing protein [Rehaibacterium terrae]|uniref:DUF1631 domain-containing protein n=1 Tax=Rehaibacterium terrae TaxID=1341696 RepID=UPI00391E0303